MTYLLTESKLNDVIETYVLKKYPIVKKVYFTTKNVQLGSTEGNPVVENIVINIIIDNSENELGVKDLYLIENKIRTDIDGVFGLEHQSYGSLWDFRFRQLATIQLDFPLKSVK